MSDPAAIPEEWIRKQVDQFLDLAKTLDNGSAMQDAVLQRAEIIMDLVQAWKTKCKEANPRPRLANPLPPEH